ncbi:MFS transporter [Curtobacterium sp. MCPF17_031]|uniref:MFS transporter n=1 Tax=Curtobacterium sp. MCPF17_031 TaxID=2175653 RepID=UPI0015E8C9D4|nr:MFS transporter [Curtobacterium sp. MCPF17_031]
MASSTPSARGDQGRMPKRRILPALIAQLTLYIAFVAPSSYSLAVRIQDLAPESRDTALSLAIGIPCAIVILITPLVGVLSDRTRSAWGRRRPWLLAGIATGAAGSVIIAVVPSLGALIAGWTVAYIGYTITAIMILAFFGDQLPENQRGRVMGLNGSITYIGPIMGILVATQLHESPAAMFLVPGALALIGGLVFVLVMRDEVVTTPKVAVRMSEIFNGFWFNPRKYSNLGWVWLSKALVFLSLAFTSIYSVFLLTSRLGLDAAAVGGVVALTGVAGVATSIIGAIGSGWVSDKVGSRKPFLLVSALLIGVAALIVGTTGSIPQFVLGSILGSFAIGVYGAVDQAVQLDVLPQEEDQNGRFLSTLGLANQIPQAVGPFLAGAVVAIAVGNYTAVYIVAGVCAVLGAAAILPISLGRRSLESTTSIEVPR